MTDPDRETAAARNGPPPRQRPASACGSQSPGERCEQRTRVLNSPRIVRLRRLLPSGQLTCVHSNRTVAAPERCVLRGRRHGVRLPEKRSNQAVRGLHRTRERLRIRRERRARAERLRPAACASARFDSSFSPLGRSGYGAFGTAGIEVSPTHSSVEMNRLGPRTRQVTMAAEFRRPTSASIRRACARVTRRGTSASGLDDVHALRRPQGLQGARDAGQPARVDPTQGGRFCHRLSPSPTAGKHTGRKRRPGGRRKLTRASASARPREEPTSCAS